MTALKGFCLFTIQNSYNQRQQVGYLSFLCCFINNKNWVNWKLVLKCYLYLNMGHNLIGDNYCICRENKHVWYYGDLSALHRIVFLEPLAFLVPYTCSTNNYVPIYNLQSLSTIWSTRRIPRETIWRQGSGHIFLSIHTSKKNNLFIYKYSYTNWWSWDNFQGRFTDID